MILTICLIVAMLTLLVAIAISFMAAEIDDSGGAFVTAWILLITLCLVIGVAVKVRPMERAELEREIRATDNRPACPCVQVKPETEKPKEL